MKQASLKVIGVYRPVISAETWHEQFQVTGDEQAAREHFEKLVLIEAVVEGLTGRFDFSKFGQVLSGYRNYPDNMQVGYDEGLLSADGECLIQRRMHCVQGLGLCASQRILTIVPKSSKADIPYALGQPSIPKRGLFRYLKPRPEEMRFSWIDTDDCVYAEFSIE